MFVRAREWKNTTLRLPPENKLKNQTSTNHTASLVLVFWHAPSERKKDALLGPPYASAAVLSKENLSDFGDAFLEIVWNS